MRAKTASTAKEPVGRVGQRRQVVIPREIFKTLRLQEGDFVAFAKQANGVLIKPKRVVDDRDDFLTAAEARQVRHALKQVKAGKTKPWAQIKHELGL
jgi:AbrB family looped-hinge helix DNA binding protein